MDIFTTYLSLIFIASLAFGAFAQAGQFCPVGGLRETVNGQGSHRLWAYVAAIAVALIGVNLLEFFDIINLSGTKPPYRTENFAYGRYIIGGFIFGFGMVLSSGCGMRNLIRIGQGSLKAILIVIVMALTAYAMTKTSLYAEIFMPMMAPFTTTFNTANSQDIGTLIVGPAGNVAVARLAFALLTALIILFFAFKNKTFRQPRYLLSALVIGLVITAGFYITGATTGQNLIDEASFMETPPVGLGTQSFSFAAPMADTVYALINAGSLAVISFGVVAVIGLPLGAFLASIYRREFKLEHGFTTYKDLIYSIIGAILVGVGSVLAMGCSIGHGLTGISTLALGSFLALASIALGAFVGIKLEPLFSKS